MESLFREILATSPTVETNSLPPLDASPSAASEEMIVLTKDEEAKSDVDTAGFMAGALGNNWMNEVDKLLESMLPSTSSATSTEEGTLPDLELGWDLDPIGTSASMVGISAF